MNYNRKELIDDVKFFVFFFITHGSYNKICTIIGALHTYVGKYATTFIRDF